MGGELTALYGRGAHRSVWEGSHRSVWVGSSPLCMGGELTALYGWGAHRSVWAELFVGHIQFSSSDSSSVIVVW